MQILQIIIDHYIFFLLFVILFTAGVRSRRILNPSKEKKLASLIMLFFSVSYWFILNFILKKELNPLLALAPLCVYAILCVVFNKILWPYKRNCQRCGKPLKLSEILASNGNICNECYMATRKEPAPAPQKTAEDLEQEMREKWKDWKPNKNVVLCFIMNDNGQVLLVDRKYKKKGPGKISGATGFFEAGENIAEVCKKCAKAETGLDIENPVYYGRINFWMPEMNLQGHIFVTSTYSGEIKESNVNRPFWTKIKKLPYSQMSVDYKVWLKRALNKQFFDYYGICDKVGYVVEDILYERDPSEELVALPETK